MSGKFNLKQKFDEHTAKDLAPLSWGELKAIVNSQSVPDGAPVALYSDEEGNELHYLYAVDIGMKDKAIILRPAGDDLQGW